jgi:hypothetical protein
VTIRNELRLPCGVAGEGDPDVPAPPLVLPHAADQVRGHLPVDQRDRTSCTLRLRGLRDLHPGVLDVTEERLECSATLVALDEERDRPLDVRVRRRTAGPRPNS